MILYHGGTREVRSPKVNYSKKHGDFGRGFYVTENKEQSIIWAQKKQYRTNGDKAIVSAYEFELPARAHVKVFASPNEEWLDFVVECRNHHSKSPYDVVIGPIADDGVSEILSYYEGGIYTKEEALKRLKIEDTYTQQVFLKQEICDELRFLESIDVSMPPRDGRAKQKGRDIDERE